MVWQQAVSLLSLFISEVVDNPVALVSNANRGRFAKVVLKGGSSL